MSSCLHRHRIDGICLSCGDCAHEIVLNQRCYYCGSTGVQVSNKPAADDSGLVPAASLVRSRSDRS